MAKEIKQSEIEEKDVKELINGRDIKRKTITADKIVVNSLSALSAIIGNIKTSGGDTRIEINESNEIIVYRDGEIRTMLTEGLLVFLGPSEVGSGAIYGGGTNQIDVNVGGDSEYEFNETAFQGNGGNRVNLGAEDFGPLNYRWGTIYLVNEPDVSSDRRIKRNIKNSKYGLKKIQKLRPVTFIKKGERRKQLGFIAQEVEKIIPESISKKNGMYGMKPTQIIPVLVKAVQELSTEVERLKKLK